MILHIVNDSESSNFNGREFENEHNNLTRHWSEKDSDININAFLKNDDVMFPKNPENI